MYQAVPRTLITDHRSLAWRRSRWRRCRACRYGVAVASSASVLPLVVPPPLRAGDRVAIVGPSGPVQQLTAVDAATAFLRGRGLLPEVAPQIAERHGYLAGGSDQERGELLQRALLDSGICAIWCSRGGYGATRLLRRLDWRRIRAESTPKHLIGYSDVTALHLAVRRELGWQSLHGPMAGEWAGAPPFTTDGFTRALDGTATGAPLPLPDGYTPQTIHAGTARGRLVGGNLSLVAALCGTPWALQGRGAIVLLEDVGEAPYRIDRMLVQLLQSGCLDGVAGIAFGFSPTCHEAAEGRPSLTLTEVLSDLLAPLGVPCIYGLPHGHTADKWTLPLGAIAELNADQATLTVLKPDKE